MEEAQLWEDLASDLVVCNLFLSFSRIELSEFICNKELGIQLAAGRLGGTAECTHFHEGKSGKRIKMTWTNGEEVKESSKIVFVIVCFKQLKD